MASLLARSVARLRFLVDPPTLAPGDVVELTEAQRYLARISATHLPCVPAGVREVVRAIAPMPGAPGGAIVDLLDMAGQPSGYWTAASVGELRRVPVTVAARGR